MKGKTISTNEIICMTFEQWEEYHLQNWRIEARNRQRKLKKKYAEDKARRAYMNKDITFCAHKECLSVECLRHCNNASPNCARSWFDAKLRDDGICEYFLGDRREE